MANIISCICIAFGFDREKSYLTSRMIATCVRIPKLEEILRMLVNILDEHIRLLLGPPFDSCSLA